MIQIFMPDMKLIFLHSPQEIQEIQKGKEVASG